MRLESSAKAGGHSCFAFLSGTVDVTVCAVAVAVMEVAGGVDPVLGTFQGKVPHKRELYFLCG